MNHEETLKLAKDTYNQAYGLVIEGDTSVAELGLELAQTSLNAWRQVGTAKNEAIGLWMLSRAQQKVGDQNSSIESASQALKIAEELKIDWMIASALEALTRASAGLQNYDALHARAVSAIDAIDDQADRELIASQFADLR